MIFQLTLWMFAGVPMFLYVGLVPRQIQARNARRMATTKQAYKKAKRNVDRTSRWVTEQQKNARPKIRSVVDSKEKMPGLRLFKERLVRWGLDTVEMNRNRRGSVDVKSHKRKGSSRVRRHKRRKARSGASDLFDLSKRTDGWRS